MLILAPAGALLEAISDYLRCLVNGQSHYFIVQESRDQRGANLQIPWPTESAAGSNF